MLKDRLANAVERLWTSKCIIINYTSNEDENGITTTNKEVIARNVPCRVSYSSDNAGTQSNTTNNISQQIKLFINSNIDIKPGSEITVTAADGTIKEYISSGITAKYTAHQEVTLINKEEYA